MRFLETGLWHPALHNVVENMLSPIVAVAGHPVLDMPYNVLSDADVAAQQKIESARQNLSCLPETDRSKAASARSRRNSGGDAVTPADTSGDVLRVSAVLDKMQNANEREYVSSVPQAIDSDDL